MFVFSERHAVYLKGTGGRFNFADMTDGGRGAGGRIRNLIQDGEVEHRLRPMDLQLEIETKNILETGCSKSRCVGAMALAPPSPLDSYHSCRLRVLRRDPVSPYII